jgi:hypothetical protein
MAKNNDKGAAPVKAKKTKTASQIAKKARNEQDAAARLLKLQREQTANNEIRAEFPDLTLTDATCRDIIEERRARRVLDGFLACDEVIGGEAISKRIMRFIGPARLKGIAKGDVAVRDVIMTVWRYAATQAPFTMPHDAE